MNNRYIVIDDYVVVEYYTDWSSTSKRKNILVARKNILSHSLKDIEEFSKNMTEEFYFQIIKLWVNVDKTIPFNTASYIIELAYD